MCLCYLSLTALAVSNSHRFSFLKDVRKSTGSQQEWTYRRYDQLYNIPFFEMIPIDLSGVVIIWCAVIVSFSNIAVRYGSSIFVSFKAASIHSSYASRRSGVISNGKWRRRIMG